MSRRFRWVLIILAALVLLPGVGLAVFLATFDANAQKPRIIAAVQGATGRALGLEGPIGLKLSLVPTLTLEGVTLANAPGGSRAEMVRLRRAEVELALLPLLSRQVEVRRLVLVGPDILLETDAAGRPNWAFAPEGAAAAAPAPAAPAEAARQAEARLGIRIGAVRVEAGRLTWRDGRTGVARVVGVESLTLAGGDGPMALSARLSLDGTPIGVEAATGPLAALLGEPPAAPWPVRAMVQALGARVTVEGGIARPREGAGWRFAVEAIVPELARLAPLLPDVPLPPLREVALTATVAETPGGLPAVTGLRLSLGAAALDAVQPGLRLASLTATLPAMDQPLALAAEGAVGAVPLRLAATLGAPGPALAGRPLAVDATVHVADATLSVKGRVREVAKRAGVELALALRVPALAALAPLAGGVALPPVRDIVLETQLAERGPGFAAGAFLRGLRLTSSAADAAGELTVVIGQRPGLAGVLASTRVDLDALRPPAVAGTAAGGPAAPGPRDARVIPDIPLPLEALRLTDSDLRVMIGTLQAEGVTIRELAGHLVIQDGKARLDPLTATLPGGRISLRAAADMTVAPPVVQVAAMSEGIDLPALLAALKQPQGTTGRLEFDIDLRGRGQDLRAVAGTAAGHVGFGLTSAQVEQGSAGLLGRALADLRGALPALGNLAEGKVGLACAAGRFALEGGVATTQALLIDSSIGKIGGEGRANLRDETLDMRLHLDLRLPVPGINLLRVRAPVPLRGTFAAPRPDYAVASLGGVAGTVEGLLRTPSNLADGILGALGGPAGLVPGSGGNLPDCGPVLTAARGGRAGPVPASMAPQGTNQGTSGAQPVPQVQRDRLPGPAGDLLRGLFGR